jgi:hypothetical protein
VNGEKELDEIKRVADRLVRVLYTEERATPAATKLGAVVTLLATICHREGVGIIELISNVRGAYEKIRALRSRS